MPFFARDISHVSVSFFLYSWIESKRTVLSSNWSKSHLFSSKSHSCSFSFSWWMGYIPPLERSSMFLATKMKHIDLSLVGRILYNHSLQYTTTLAGCCFTTNILIHWYDCADWEKYQGTRLYFSRRHQQWFFGRCIVVSSVDCAVRQLTDDDGVDVTEKTHTLFMNMHANDKWHQERRLWLIRTHVLTMSAMGKGSSCSPYDYGSLCQQ